MTTPTIKNSRWLNGEALEVPRPEPGFLSRRSCRNEKIKVRKSFGDRNTRIRLIRWVHALCGSIRFRKEYSFRNKPGASAERERERIRDARYCSFRRVRFWPIVFVPPRLDVSPPFVRVLHRTTLVRTRRRHSAGETVNLWPGTISFSHDPVIETDLLDGASSPHRTFLCGIASWAETVKISRKLLREKFAIKSSTGPYARGRVSTNSAEKVRACRVAAGAHMRLMSFFARMCPERIGYLFV